MCWYNWKLKTGGRGGQIWSQVGTYKGIYFIFIEKALPNQYCQLDKKKIATALHRK